MQDPRNNQPRRRTDTQHLMASLQNSLPHQAIPSRQPVGERRQTPSEAGTYRWGITAGRRVHTGRWTQYYHWSQRNWQVASRQTVADLHGVLRSTLRCIGGERGVCEPAQVNGWTTTV